MPDKAKPKMALPPAKKPNSYILWSTEHRVEVQKKHPKMTPQQVTAELGAQWRNLSEAQKNKYREKAKK